VALTAFSTFSGSRYGRNNSQHDCQNDHCGNHSILKRPDNDKEHNGSQYDRSKCENTTRKVRSTSVTIPTVG